MDRRRLICVLAVLCVISLTAMTVALCPGAEKTVFTPPPFDSAAETGTPAVPEGLGYRTLDADAFRVAVCGEILAEGTNAVVYLTNPTDNDAWLKVRILSEKGEILGESGLIRPGEYVRNIRMEPMPVPGTPIVLKIMAYEPETYHSRGAVTVHTHVGE